MSGGPGGYSSVHRGHGPPPGVDPTLWSWFQVCYVWKCRHLVVFLI